MESLSTPEVEVPAEAGSDSLSEASCPSLRQSPLVPGDHDNLEAQKGLEATRSRRCYSTLKHDMRLRKGRYAEGTSEDELGVPSAGESGNSSTTSTDGLSMSSVDERNTRSAGRRRGMGASGRPLRSFREQLRKIVNSKNAAYSPDSSVFDESSGPESKCSSSPRSCEPPSPHASSDGCRSFHSGSSKSKAALKECFQDLDALTDRLRLRHEETLRKFSAMSPLESDIDEGRRLRVKARKDRNSKSGQRATQRARLPAQASLADGRSGENASATKKDFLPARRRSRQLPVCELPSADLPSFPTTTCSSSKGSLTKSDQQLD